MKAFKLNLFSLVAVTLLFGSLQLYAQQDSNNDHNSNKIVIIKKYTDKDGITTVEKIVKDGEELQGINIRDIEEELAFNEELNETLKDFNINIDVDEVDGQTIIQIESLGEEIQRAIHEEMEDVNWSFDSDDHHIRIQSSCGNKKPFLGVVINNTDGEAEGLRISSVVNNSAAEAAGLDDGDIITAIDGQGIRNFDDLSEVLDKFEIDDEVNISYLRDGRALQTSATLKAKNKSSNTYNFNWNNDNWNHNSWTHRSHRNPCKPFIGVYLSQSRDGEGVRITDVIDDTPADEVDLMKNDVIVAVDGVEVGSFNEVLTERDKHKAGDFITLTFLRDGEVREVEAQFPACDETVEELPSQERVQPQNDTQVNLNTAPSRHLRMETLRFSLEERPYLP